MSIRVPPRQKTTFCAFFIHYYCFFYTLVYNHYMFEYIFIGFILGLLAAFLVGLLDPLLERISSNYKLYRIKPKQGNYVATYSHQPLEPWMIEEYNELFIIKNIGKKFIKIKLIDSTFNKNRIGTQFNIDKRQFTKTYVSYRGEKALLATIEEIINDN